MPNPIYDAIVVGVLLILERWGLLEQLEATGCPPIHRYHFDFGAVSIDGSPHPSAGIRVAYAPRRTILDNLPVAAARRAEAEVREGFNVEELIFEDGAVTGVSGRDAGGAGYNKDPITAQSISDAFRDAGLCAGAVRTWLEDTLSPSAMFAPPGEQTVRGVRP